MLSSLFATNLHSSLSCILHLPDIHETGSARALLFSPIIKGSCFSGCIYIFSLYLLWFTSVMVLSAFSSVMNSLLVLSVIILGFSSLQTSGRCMSPTRFVRKNE